MRLGWRATVMALALVMLVGFRPSVRAQAAPTLTRGEAAQRVQAEADAVCLFAVNVGKGDALILRAGDYVALIDAGKALALGRIEAALAMMGCDRLQSEGLDAVFLTHTDDDHVDGLSALTAEVDGLPTRTAKAVYASAMYTDVGKKGHPAVAAADALCPDGGGVKWLRRGDAVAVGDGATLSVLAPDALFEDEDDNSLVMMLESPHGRMLLTGDMELLEEAWLLEQGDDLKCDVLKVPNHGDDDTVSAAFANACSARIAVISTDSAEKPGTPDPGVVSRLRAAGGDVLVTQDSGLGVLVTLKDGVATAEYVDFDAPPVAGVSIARVDPADDTVTLKNEGDAPFDLGRCYLCSDKGGELFIFPDGQSVAPGGTLTVGSRATEGDFDVLWDEKRVVNKKKTDVVSLYDCQGRLIDRMDNGM